MLEFEKSEIEADERLRLHGARVDRCNVTTDRCRSTGLPPFLHGTTLFPLGIQAKVCVDWRAEVPVFLPLDGFRGTMIADLADAFVSIQEPGFETDFAQLRNGSVVVNNRSRLSEVVKSPVSLLGLAGMGVEAFQSARKQLTRSGVLSPKP